MSTTINQTQETKWRKTVRYYSDVPKSSSFGASRIPTHLSDKQLPEAVETLIRLLTEYTCKLVEEHKLYYGRKVQFARRVVVLFLIDSFFLGTIAMRASHFPYSIPALFVSPWAETAIAKVFMIATIVLSGFLWYLLLPKDNRKDVLRRISQLEKLVRRSSQLEEFGVASFSKRLELDFRISDAESAIVSAQKTLRWLIPDDRPYINKPSAAYNQSKIGRPAKTRIAS